MAPTPVASSPAPPTEGAETATRHRRKAITQGAVERGVLGPPTFFIDGPSHCGQDRPDFLKQALETQ